MSDLRQGDCIEVMREIPDKSVDCIVTSPPYWKGFEGVACANTNRNFIGIDLDKHYCDIAKERITRMEQEVVKNDKLP